MKNIFWFRRDLRLFDNVGFSAALKSNLPVQPLFIFDTEILDELPKDDARVQFIHQELEKMHRELQQKGSGLKVLVGKPEAIFKDLIKSEEINAVYANHDYEPYALARDAEVADLLKTHDIQFHTFKDQVIFEKNEVLKDDGTPYTVFTPFKKKWQRKLEEVSAEKAFKDATVPLENLVPSSSTLPTLEEIGFSPSAILVKPYNLDEIEYYKALRDFPAKNGTSHLSPHLRFGTVSVRQMMAFAQEMNETFMSELIWREFFMQILFHFPKVVNENFKPQYNSVPWRNAKDEFEKWCAGKTGYPMVDAGMRELNATGYMHNRVRMVVASFMCKHLLIDWRWGEAYFARKLLDYELSSNNGNWQWAAGTGCDAAPYFRIFNPASQWKKFDPDNKYVNQWVPEWNSPKYAKPMVEHKMARTRALEAYKSALDNA